MVWWLSVGRWDPEGYYWFGSEVSEAVSEHVRLLNLRLLEHVELDPPEGDEGEGGGKKQDGTGADEGQAGPKTSCPFGFGCGLQPALAPLPLPGRAMVDS